MFGRSRDAVETRPDGGVFLQLLRVPSQNFTSVSIILLDYKLEIYSTHLNFLHRTLKNENAFC